MAPSLTSTFLLLLLLSLSSTSATHRHALILPVTKDTATLQYITTVHQGTPLVPTNLVLNLGGRFLWINCDDYTSSSYRPVHCDSPQCLIADPDFCIEDCDTLASPPYTYVPSPSPTTYPYPLPGCSGDGCKGLPPSPESCFDGSCSSPDPGCIGDGCAAPSPSPISCIDGVCDGDASPAASPISCIDGVCDGDDSPAASPISCIDGVCDGDASPAASPISCIDGACDAPSPSPTPTLPGCATSSCGVYSDNPIFPTGSTSEIGEDTLSLPCNLTVPSFYFQCTPSYMLDGLTNGTAGMAGLARSALSLPSQLSSAFSLCLPSSSSSSSHGAIFFNASAPFPLTYTPLLTNPVNREGPVKLGVPSAEYFIGVTSIRVKRRAVRISPNKLLSIDVNGVGGTKLSTVSPFMTLETSIYTAVTEAFDAAMGNVRRVGAVGPLGMCYDAAEIRRGRSGPKVPEIDLVMGSVYWRLYGANTMVRAEEGVMCLGVVDGGEYPVTKVVVGGLQMEDNLIEFDLGSSMLGFSGSLLRRRSSCAWVAYRAMPRQQHL